MLTAFANKDSTRRPINILHVLMKSCQPRSKSNFAKANYIILLRSRFGFQAEIELIDLYYGRKSVKLKYTPCNDHFMGRKRLSPFTLTLQCKHITLVVDGLV